MAVRHLSTTVAVVFAVLAAPVAGAAGPLATGMGVADAVESTDALGGVSVAPPDGPPNGTPGGPPDDGGPPNGTPGPPDDGGPPDDAGPPNGTPGPPEDVPAGPPEDIPAAIGGNGDGLASFSQTAPLPAAQVDPASISGAVRVERTFVANATASLDEDEENGTATLTVDVSGENATNVTVYVQAAALNVSDVENLTAEQNGTEISVQAGAGPGDSPWAGFEVDDFSEGPVTLSYETGFDGSEEDNESETDSAFANATKLNESQVDPDNLAGKIAVDSEVANSTAVTLAHADSKNTTFTIKVTDENASDVTLFFQTQAISATQGVSLDEVSVLVDGSTSNVTVDRDAGPGNSPWIAVTIDFSNATTRNLTFTSVGSTGSLEEFDSDGDGELSPSEVLDGISRLNQNDGFTSPSEILDALSEYNEGEGKGR